MSNLASILSIVKSRFSRFDTFGIIDDDMMYREVILLLKSFGNLSTVKYEDVIKINNGTGKLPNNFFKLLEARLCEPLAYSRSNRDVEIHTIMNTEYYNLIHELSTSWNECESCCKEQDIKVMKKEHVVANNLTITCNYNKGAKVSLKKGAIKKYCDSTYGNFTPECGHEIDINNNIISANFNEGELYIMYNGFPLDSDGDIDIPDTPNGTFERYVEDHLASYVATSLFEAGISDLASMIQMYENKRKISKTNAKNELVMNAINLNRLSNKMVVDNTIQYKKKGVI